MCTVSYIPSKKGFILTSNRDELTSRATVSPKQYEIKKKQLLFPKDKQAEGSWIACDENGQVSCLLNGAFEQHKRRPPYNRSRGKVLLESFSHENTYTFIENVDLRNVEPFTLILAKKDSLVEFKWDGTKKHVKELDRKKDYLWSSPTLYPKHVSDLKEKWFKNWLIKYEKSKQKNVLEFHKTTHGNDPSKDVNSLFSSDLRTVSITQIIIENSESMHYFDLLKDTEKQVSFASNNEA